MSLTVQDMRGKDGAGDGNAERTVEDSDSCCGSHRGHVYWNQVYTATCAPLFLCISGSISVKTACQEHPCTYKAESGSCCRGSAFDHLRCGRHSIVVSWEHTRTAVLLLY